MKSDRVYIWRSRTVDKHFKKIRKNQDILDVGYDDMRIVGRLNVQRQGGGCPDHERFSGCDSVKMLNLRQEYGVKMN
jgi:hypothetical protein